MTATEDAARLRQLAKGTNIIRNLEEIDEALKAKVKAVTECLGVGHPYLDEAIGPFSQAIDEVNALAVSLGAAFGILGGIANRIA